MITSLETKITAFETTKIAGFSGLFERYFDVVQADTAEMRDLVYRLRYQVYCVENPYLDQNSSRREIDADDDRAGHILIIHRETGKAAGTARVIFPARYSHRPLPIEGLLDFGNCTPLYRLPFATTGEVSRFAVPKTFRRWRGECNARMRVNASAEFQVMPLIALGLLSGVLRLCLQNGISHVAAVMEPSFIRLLSRFGLGFQAIGGLVEYHGTRQPCVARIQDLISQVREKESLLWPFWDAEISAVAPRAPAKVRR
jgi:N-acyl amino acid synthase of PEP-CTERM/exosortase system